MAPYLATVSKLEDLAARCLLMIPGGGGPELDGRRIPGKEFLKVPQLHIGCWRGQVP